MCKNQGAISACQGLPLIPLRTCVVHGSSFILKRKKKKKKVFVLKCCQACFCLKWSCVAVIIVISAPKYMRNKVQLGP